MARSLSLGEELGSYIKLIDSKSYGDEYRD
jgi:hypothetical protein